MKRLGLEAPLLLPDASPRFNSILHRFNTVAPESPLRDAWAIANRTGGVAPVIDVESALADAAQAHAHMESSAHIGKIVLKVAE